MTATIRPAGPAASARATGNRRGRLCRLAELAGAVALAGHGLIHLIGVALLWQLGETADLAEVDVRPAPGSGWGLAVGGIWMLATALFLTAAVLLLRRSARWWGFAGVAVLASIPVLLPMATATGAGLVIDLAVLAAVLPAWRATRSARPGGAPAYPVPGEARRVRPSWLGLASQPAPTEVFSAELVASLPEPARRWLTHAIPVGTPLWTTAHVTMRGEIKLGNWRRFSARQIIAPGVGYIWAATAWMTGLPVRGFDRFSAGTGEMRWRMLGLIPVMTAVGADMARSAAGRLASEIVLAPTGFRTAVWTAGRPADHVIGTWQIDGETESVELRIGPRGEVQSALLSRWGNPDGQPFGRYPFGCTVHSEQEFAGLTLPATLTAGWWWGTARQPEGEFFRAGITAVALG